MDLGVEYRLMNGYGGTGEYDLVLSVRNRGPASARFVRFDLRLTHATALWTYASSRRCSTWPEGWNSTARCWIGTLRPGQQTTVSIRLRKSPLSSSFVYEAAVVGLGSESKPDDNVLVDEIDWF